MSHYARPNRVLAEVTTATSAATLADIGTWTVTNPITVARVGALVTVAQTGAAPTLSFDLRPTYGSDTGRQAGKVGVCQFPVGGVGVGKTVTVEVRSKINAGQQIVCAVTVVAGAGTVIPIIEWVPRTENSANQGSSQLGGASQPTPLALMGVPPMLDGADAGTPLELGGSAPVVVRKAEESDQLDWEPRVEGEPGYVQVRDIATRQATDIGPGPRPFPHQQQAAADPEQAERQKPWDEALKEEKQQQDEQRKQRAEEQERRRRENETPEERERREEQERQRQEQEERRRQQQQPQPA